MLKNLVLVVWVLMAISFSGDSFSSPNIITTQEKIFTVSDIHFNPFIDCNNKSPCELIQKLAQEKAENWKNIFDQYAHSPVSHYGQNTNYALLQSMLTAIGDLQKKEHTIAVIILGDFFAHHFKENYAKYSGDDTREGYEAFTRETLRFLTLAIKQRLPAIDIYPVVGNNDSYSGDYITVARGKFFKDTSLVWGGFIDDKNNRKSMIDDFSNAGYYTVTIPTSHHRIIVLNTVIFTSHLTGQNIDLLATEELQWLEKQLTAAEQAHEHVLIVFHIPPGIDVYGTVTSWFKQIKIYWDERYTLRFIEILNNHPGVVTGMIAGHSHKDVFGILNLKANNEIPLMITPSISPIYRNNPGIKIYTFDDMTFTFKNFDVYYLSLENNQWIKEYNFNEAYQPHCKASCDLLEGLKKLKNSSDLNTYYQTCYMVTVRLDIPLKDRAYYHCALGEFTQPNYQRCIERI